MIPKAGKLTRLLKSFLVGLAAGTGRLSAPTPSEPSPVRDEKQNLERSEADYRVRTIGTVAYTYKGPMIGLHQGGMLDRTTTWKTVTDRNLKNMCIEGTGWSESET